MDYGINTYNNFLLSIPKKQAKSYEIDLGQNNGAYDEELLIRYGDNTLNHMKNKNRGGKLNMDVKECILGRRSIRKYSDKAVDDEIIREITEEASYSLLLHQAHRAPPVK